MHLKSVHNKIKDFKCNKCEYECYSKGNLKRHVKMIHSKIKDHTCELCDYICSSKDSLKIHIKHVHDNNSQADSLDL